MGTLYFAQVDRLPSADDSWEKVSRWELGKDYAFHMALSGLVTEGWPADFEAIGAEDSDDDYTLQDIADGGCHIDGELFAAADPKEWALWARQLHAHVTGLIPKSEKVRVTIWEG